MLIILAFFWLKIACYAKFWSRFSQLLNCDTEGTELPSFRKVGIASPLITGDTSEICRFHRWQKFPRWGSPCNLWCQPKVVHNQTRYVQCDMTVVVSNKLLSLGNFALCHGPSKATHNFMPTKAHRRAKLTPCRPKRKLRLPFISSS